MTLAPHLICIALVLADLVARSWRTQLVVHGVGHPLTFWRSFVINSFGDAAATLTPLRVAGQPARVLALVYDGVPLEATLVALSVEAAITYATVAVCGVFLVIAAVPEWPALLGGIVRSAGEVVWRWGVLAGILLVVAAMLWHSRWRWRWRWIGGRDGGNGTQDDVGRSGKPSLGQRLSNMWKLVRQVPLHAQLLAIPLSVVNVMARVAILPVLAQLLTDPPGWGTLWLASFTLVYGQVAVPTPAGAGVMDAGFLAGAAAVGNDDAGRALLFWRIYSSGAGLALGLLFGAPRYGVRPLVRLVGAGLGKKDTQVKS